MSTVVNFPEIPAAVMKGRRSAYAYPAVALHKDEVFAPIYFSSTCELDFYLNGFLHSAEEMERVLGYLGVIYWGHYSGQDGRIRAGRALGKVKLTYFGTDREVKGKLQRVRGVLDFGEERVAGLISQATRLLEKDDYFTALTVLMELPGLQLAFASKVCAFIAPAKCGVMDSVIAERYPEMGFEMASGYVKGTVENRKRYGDYCLWLQHVAKNMNADVEYSQWVDRDGKAQTWRALDVERALY